MKRGMKREVGVEQGGDSGCARGGPFVASNCMYILRFCAETVRA
jgi:hypothetical protein